MAIIGITLAVVCVAHAVFIVNWMIGNFDLVDFFNSRKTAILFFVPVIGFVAFAIFAFKKRIESDGIFDEY